MKSLIFILSFVFLSTSFAAKFNYKKYWTPTELKNSEVALTIYTKDSPLPYLKNLATMTISKDNKASSEQVVGFFKKVLGTKKWAYKKTDGLDIYETYEPQGTAIYRLAYNKKTSQFSIGVVQLRFLLPSYLELHQLQVEKLTGTPTKKTAALIYQLLIPTVFAQVNSQAVNNIIDQIGNKINGGLNNAGDGFRDLAGSVRGAKDTVNNLADSARDLGSDVKDASSELSGTVKKSLSSRNTAKLAAVGTLTAVAVGSIAAFALHASWELAKKAFYEVNTQFSPEETERRLKEFEGALRSFKDASPKLMELNSKMTLLASSVMNLSNLPTELSLADIEADIIKKRRSLTEATTTDLTCPECSKEERLMEINRLQDLADAIKRAGGKNVKDALEMTCEDLDTVYEQWISSERTLQQARLGIVNDFKLYMGFISSTAKKRAAFREDPKQLNHCIMPHKEVISSLSTTAITTCDGEPNSMAASCRRLRTARAGILNCNASDAIKVNEDMLADAEESNGRFNETIRKLAGDLTEISCSAKSDTGACIAPGPYVEMQSMIERNLGLTYNQCSDRRFAQKIKPVPTIKNAFSAKNVARVVADQTAFEALISKHTSPAAVQSNARTYQQQLLTGK